MVIEKQRTQMLVSHVAFGAISATRVIVTMFLKQRAIARYSWNGVMCSFVYVASTAYQWYISRIVDRCHGYSSKHVVIWMSAKRDLRPNVRDDKRDEQSRPLFVVRKIATLHFIIVTLYQSFNRLSSTNIYVIQKSQISSTL